MSGERTSAYYDGWLYARVFDPLLADLRGFVAKHVPEGARVLEACCGTGALAIELATTRGATVLGVDRSPRMIAHAEVERARCGVAGASFRCADCARLSDLAAGAFDLATVVMGLHEMPAPARPAVLRELGRVARRVLAIDFGVPMPWNPAGIRNRFFETIAGPAHFAGFRDYTRRGGLPALAREAGLRVEKERTLDAGTLVVLTLAGGAA